MSRKEGSLTTSVLILILGFVLLIWGFIESSEKSKVMLYCFGFVFLLIAVILFIYRSFYLDEGPSY